MMEDRGRLTVFGDDTAKSTKITLNLTQMSKDDVVGGVASTKSNAFRISFKTADGAYRFGFDSKQKQRQMMESINRFIGISHFGTYIDLKLFKEMRHSENCRGVDCPAMSRIVQCLDYFESMKLSQSEHHDVDAMSAFTDFCDDHYGKINALRDYIHFITNHSEPAAVRAIASRLQFKCDSVGRCQGTRRHFRERGGRSEEKEEMDTNCYVETMDSLHVFLCHLEEMGLRIPMDAVYAATTAVDEEQDDDLVVDAVFKKMVAEVSKRQKVLSVKRLDGATNSKFVISTVESKSESKEGMPF